MKNWFNWKQLKWNLKYAITDWKNSLQRATFNTSIIVKTIESNFDKNVYVANPDESSLRDRNASEYYRRNAANAYHTYKKLPEHRLVYQENGRLLNEEGKRVGYKDVVETGYEFQKWFNTLPK